MRRAETSGLTTRHIVVVRHTVIAARQIVSVARRVAIHWETVNELPKETSVARVETSVVKEVELAIAVA